MPRYRVMVDDNFHYMNEEERYEQGLYKSCSDALEVCRKIVDQSLEGMHKPGMTAEALYGLYTSFGEDPFILVLDGEDESAAAFSAWDHAKDRCLVICGVGGV